MSEVVVWRYTLDGEDHVRLSSYILLCEFLVERFELSVDGGIVVEY